MQKNFQIGFRWSVASLIVKNKLVPMEFVGVNDQFKESGKPSDLMKKYGLSKESIIDSCEKVLKENNLFVIQIIKGYHHRRIICNPVTINIYHLLLRYHHYRHQGPDSQEWYQSLCHHYQNYYLRQDLLKLSTQYHYHVVTFCLVSSFEPEILMGNIEEYLKFLRYNTLNQRHDHKSLFQNL